MQLGNFSISLAVKDVKLSKAFYEKLGFQSFGGDIEQNWVILKNGATIIGLFQGMFDENMLTFNPGWDENAQSLDSYTDIRELQAKLKKADISFVTEADPGSTGPASFVIQDPDGNPILIDQHI